MAAANESSFNWSRFFLIFFCICFVLVMTIGFCAIFTYNANAPEPAPSGATHGSMILPGSGKYAPHIEIYLPT
jgi:hypothetical protein